MIEDPQPTLVVRMIARIHSTTAEGAIHSLATFAQFIEPGPDGFQVSGVHIEDRPEFPWRGLMLDVCRHWMPVEVVKRNLEAMASEKLNVMHWHLSEDDGFRVESKRYPRLHQTGLSGCYYTQDQIRDVVAYGHGLGIRVIPEFDMPGHSTACFAGYPVGFRRGYGSPPKGEGPHLGGGSTGAGRTSARPTLTNRS